MKHITSEKEPKQKNGYISDDENVRYKINTQYFSKIDKSHSKFTNKQIMLENDDENIRYKFPKVLKKTKPQKSKIKPKIKVNFWSNKQKTHAHDTKTRRHSTNRKHTAINSQDSLSAKPKTSVVKVRKQVSLLPSPLFSDNHIPMVTVPDDLTIQLNEEEANDLCEDLNLSFVNSNIWSSGNSPSEPFKRKTKNSGTRSSPKVTKGKRSSENSNLYTQGNENELEFFSKYVVQKLRKMETNQRIYSENLINTVLMLGQLGKLNGKSKINDA